jgi:hypothetical protein
MEVCKLVVDLAIVGRGLVEFPGVRLSPPALSLNYLFSSPFWKDTWTLY